jgi:EpsI family protein
MTTVLSHRCAVLAILVVAAGQLAAHDPVSIPLAAPLAALPQRLGAWRGADQPPLDPEILKVLGADDYLNRIYQRADGALAGVYVAYYGAQREGDAIHSPQQCLPGNGWLPVSRSHVMLGGDGQRAEVNRYVVAQRDARQLVYYWFEGRGRIVASEYLNKWFLLTDGLRRGRSEGALVRVITPFPAGGAIAERAADDLLLVLGRDVHIGLSQVLP